MSEETALNYPLNRAFALANFAMEANPFASVVRESAGYIGQEAERLKAKC